MKYFLGVTNKDKWSKLKLGDKGFWCVYKSNSPQVGDLLFLHRTKKGIFQIYRILGGPYKSNEVDCSVRGMATINIELVVTFDNPLTVKDFRANVILAKSGPLGRNFQSTIFELNLEQGIELEKIIKIKNPLIEY